MRRIGWLFHLAAPAVVVAAITLGSTVLPGRLATRVSAASIRGCPPQTSFVTSVSKGIRKDPIEVHVNLRPKIGQAGDEVGQTLALRAGTSELRSFALSAESFAAAPVANVVVFGQRDSSGSKVRAVDLETSCEFSLFATTDAVRSAVISPGLDTLYVHSVTASNRADRGVRLVDLGAGTSRVVVPPLPAAEPFGITFATLLRWSLASSELAVQSCGMALCRTRVLDVASGRIQTIADPLHGQLVGATADRLVAFDVCPGRPCPLLAIDRSTGAATRLVDDAYSAAISNDGDAAIVEVDTPSGRKEIRP
jgi:hypothetical protein